VIAALVVTAVLAVQGLIIILPSNYLIYQEMIKETPGQERIARISRRYFYSIALQGALQLGSILITAKFSVGL